MTSTNDIRRHQTAPSGNFYRQSPNLPVLWDEALLERSRTKRSLSILDKALLERSGTKRSLSILRRSAP